MMFYSVPVQNDNDNDGILLEGGMGTVYRTGSFGERQWREVG